MRVAREEGFCLHRVFFFFFFSGGFFGGRSGLFLDEKKGISWVGS